ncbi:hypothetical protein CR513_23333, partial [Mucuna pruriens]
MLSSFSHIFQPFLFGHTSSPFTLSASSSVALGKENDHLLAHLKVTQIEEPNSGYKRMCLATYVFSHLLS